MNHSKRAFQRTVVFLDKRHRSVPNKTELGRLATAKRISDISFTKNDSSSQIGDLLVRAFPPLTGKDLSSLEIITSYARGHAMRTVATGLQSGVQLMDHFGGSRRKKIFIFLPSQALSSSTSSSTSTSTSTSLSTVSLPLTSGTSSALSLSTATSTSSSSIAPVPATSTATSTSLLSTVILPPTSLSFTVNLPSTSTTTSTSLSSTVTLPPTSLSTATLTSTSSRATLLSPSSSSLISTLPVAQPSTSTSLDLMPLPVDGASTRRYLTAMATANARGSTSDESSDLSDESDSNHGGHNAGPSVVSSDSEDDINEVIVYSEEARLYGYVTDDLSTSGVITGEGVHSRTTEVLQCINILEDRGQSTAISFLIHSFEEFTWQGTEDGRIMVAVLLPFSCPLASKRRLVSMLNTVANSPHIYFWIAKDSSHEAQKVRVKYGVSQSPGIVVFVLAPCHSRNMPQCVEIFEESNLDCAGLQESIGRAQALYSAMRDERKKLDDWRKQRQSQELQYQALQSSPSNSTNIASSSLGTSSNNTVNNQYETSQTRAQRRGRVTAPPTNGGGTTIGVHINNGKKFSRAFEKNAFFQEVYDWIGSLVEVPLHFTLQRGREVVRHSDHLQGDEVLDLLERNTDEMTNLEQSLVSFKGNYPSDEEELSETMNDEDHEKKDEGARMEKKKRKDQRSHRNRKGKRKREDAKHLK